MNPTGLYQLAVTAAGSGSEQRYAATVLLWIALGVIIVTLISPRVRRTGRQIVAVGGLAFREGLRQKVLWTALGLAFIPGLIAYWSEADGTHVGRAQLILSFCIGAGEVLGAGLIVLMCALSVAREIESRVMHTFGTKPVPRWVILMGKAAGFWCIDLLFLAVLLCFTGVLVRCVPLRAEHRTALPLASTGTWEDLRRNALTTRAYHPADGEVESKSRYKMLKAGQKGAWLFTLDDAKVDSVEPLAFRMQMTSTQMFASHIDDVTVRVTADGGKRALFEKTSRVPQDRPFEIHIDRAGVPVPGVLSVEVYNPAPMNLRSKAASMVVAVKMGQAQDTLLGNLSKAFVLMALQGWILACVTTCWSGILSFPVTVAFGLLMIVGGELSRQALELMQSGIARANAEQGAGAAVAAVQDAQNNSGEILVRLLQLLPDFRAAGGPAAFIEGTYLPGWVLAHAVLMMGLLRGIGWAIPGILLFQRREVGR